MKTVLLIVVAGSLFGCASLKSEPSYTKKHPSSHIIVKDKKTVKENLKFKKEHEKAVQKKREELAMYHQNQSTGKKKKH